MLMFLTYTVTWLTFFLYPAIGIRAPEAYVVTTAVFMLNCGINSIIYLILNNEVSVLIVKTCHLTNYRQMAISTISCGNKKPQSYL